MVHEPNDPEMTALYLERYLNYGLTATAAVRKPIIGIAQTGSDLALVTATYRNDQKGA